MNYLFKIPPVQVVHGRINFVLEKCKGKKVLHLGCADEGLTQERINQGKFTHTRLLEIAKEVVGVDISEDGIKLMKEMGMDGLIQGDVEHLEKIRELQGQGFDIILASEIIEHLNNPGLFLQGAKSIFSSNTKMIITIPNEMRITGLNYKFKGYEFVHPDHNYWFSYKTLTSLLRKNDYEIKEILTYSFVNHAMPIFKKLLEKLGQKGGENDSNAFNFSDKLSTNSDSLSHGVKIAAQVLIRRILYKINPFFADGIICVVELGHKKNLG